MTALEKLAPQQLDRHELNQSMGYAYATVFFTQPYLNHNTNQKPFSGWARALAKAGHILLHPSVKPNVSRCASALPPALLRCLSLVDLILVSLETSFWRNKFLLPQDVAKAVAHAGRKILLNTIQCFAVKATARVS